MDSVGSRPRGCPLKIPPISDVVGIISERLVVLGGRHGNRSYFSLDSVFFPLPLFSFSSFYFRGDDKRADHNLAATRWRITLNKPPVLFSLQLLHDIIFSTRNERCESVLYDIKYLSRERERKEKVAWVRVESGRKTMAKFNSRSRRCVVSSSLSSSKIVLP